MRYDIKRFLTAQKEAYSTAYAEVLNGRKETHWAWYIIPQLKGLGVSDRAVYYGIDGMGEAKAYWQNKLLRTNYLRFMELFLKHEEKDATAIMGFPDDLKLRSSVTLFLEAARELSQENDTYTEGITVLETVLEEYYGGEEDEKTLELLGKAQKGGEGR